MSAPLHSTGSDGLDSSLIDKVTDATRALTESYPVRTDDSRESAVFSASHPSAVSTETKELNSGDEPLSDTLARQISRSLQQDPRDEAVHDVHKVHLSRVRAVLLGAIMMSTTFVASATIASTLLCLPSASADLGLSELNAQWIASAYSLANGCGLLVSGRLADLYDRKYLYSLGMGGFCILSIVSGVVRNYIGLVVVRALAGLGMSIALPAAFGIVGVTFHTEPRRTIAFAALALGYPVGSGPGMVFAGAISNLSRSSWQFNFFVLAGLSLMSSTAGLYVIPLEKPRIPSAERQIDYIGAVSITIAMSLFSFSMTQGGLVSNGWREPYIPVLFVLSVVLMIAFGLWEKYTVKHSTTPPLVDLGIFTRHDGKVSSVLAITFAAYVAIAGWMYLTTIFFENVLSESPLLNAIHVLAAPIVGVGACLIVPILAPKIRAPILLVIGGLSTALAHLLFAVEPVGRTYWTNSFLSNIFNPLGADFTVGIGSILISNLVDENEQSLAGALFQTSLQIATTVGVCLCSLVQTVVEQRGHSLLQGLRAAFWMMAGFAWLASVIAAITLRKVKLAKNVRQLEYRRDSL